MSSTSIYFIKNGIKFTMRKCSKLFPFKRVNFTLSEVTLSEGNIQEGNIQIIPFSYLFISYCLLFIHSIRPHRGKVLSLDTNVRVLYLHVCTINHLLFIRFLLGLGNFWGLKYFICLSLNPKVSIAKRFEY